jgi:hypothetical protein
MPRPVKATFKAYLFAFPLGVLLTLFTIYIPASDQNRQSHFVRNDLDPNTTPLPDYLDDSVPPITTITRYTPHGKCDPIFPFLPDFGIEVTEYEFGTPAYWDIKHSPEQISWFLLVRTRFGWPFRAAYLDSSRRAMRLPYSDQKLAADHAKIQQKHDDNIKQRTGYRAGFDAPAWIHCSSYHGVFRLPLAPIIHGLLANLAIHTTIASIPFILFAVIRRDHRKYNNRCLTCGYELNDLQTCPECGTESALNPT